MAQFGTEVRSRESANFSLMLEGKGTPGCGAVILDAYHILTAAHCGKVTKYFVAGTNTRLNDAPKKQFHRIGCPLKFKLGKMPQ